MQHKETDRSAKVREELRKSDFRLYWDVENKQVRIGYWTNGLGKAVLLLEHSNEKGQWDSWDMYRPLTTENSIDKTLGALDEYSGVPIRDEATA